MSYQITSLIYSLKISQKKRCPIWDLNPEFSAHKTDAITSLANRALWSVGCFGYVYLQSVVFLHIDAYNFTVFMVFRLGGRKERCVVSERIG